jgi:oligoribonuclease NrnB/cAMP/cGMP phosphodiesterase (DHH superfamily)
MKCFYHSADLDGHCSGAIVRKAYPQAELIGINYDDDFPWEKLNKNELVFMVDFSLEPFSDMERLNDSCLLMWVDHHKTSIEDAHKNGFLAKRGQSLEVGRAACELVWDWLFPNKRNETVRLLGRYDVWDLQQNTLELQNGLRLNDTLPTNDELWNNLLSEHWSSKLTEAIKYGEVLLKKQKMDNKSYAKACSFDTEIDGLKVIALNRGFTNSKIFDSVYDPEKHDAMMTFIWRKGQWTVTLYSDKEDVDGSIVCKARGGGGHKGAAGFQCKELPFELK